MKGAGTIGAADRETFGKNLAARAGVATKGYVMKRGTVRTLGFSAEAAARAAAVKISPGVHLQEIPVILSEESRGTTPARAAGAADAGRGAPAAALDCPVREGG